MCADRVTTAVALGLVLEVLAHAATSNEWMPRVAFVLSAGPVAAVVSSSCRIVEAAPAIVQATTGVVASSHSHCRRWRAAHPSTLENPCLWRKASVATAVPVKLAIVPPPLYCNHPDVASNLVSEVHFSLKSDFAPAQMC